MTASATLPLLTTDTSAKSTATLRWLVAVCFLWASSLAVTALWVAGGGIQALTAGNAETLNTIGRITGLAAALLLLYQVLLMARVPLFERAFGRDGITRMHRWVGFSSFWLFSAHIVLLVLGYAAQAGVNPLLQLWVFIWNYPGMLLATAGTLLLLLVVVTSIRRARRRLRYESWHLLHLYGYLGAGFAVPHMLWTGADFLDHPLAASAWWVLWGATAAAVLVYRIAVPLFRSARHDIRVHLVAPDGAHGVSVRMRGRRLDALGARSGQFFVWRFLDGPGWTRGHPFSLAAAPNGHELVIAARITGDGTRRLTTLRPGTRVMIEGPYGEMTGRARRGRKLLLLGAGAGVAPLVALLESEQYAPGAAILVTRDHADAEIMRSRAIARLVERRGLRYGVLNGPRARTGSSWLPASHAAWDGADLLRRLAGDLDAYDVFVCGPAAWMSALRVDLRRAGVPADRIHSESFTI